MLLKGKTASLGRVLGNRDTLYKYLNPHLVAIGTMSESSRSISVYLLDTIIGGLVWSTVHTDLADGTSSLSVTISENWLVYSYPDNDTAGAQTKIVSLELFEPASSEVSRFVHIALHRVQADVSCAEQPSPVWIV